MSIHETSRNTEFALDSLKGAAVIAITGRCGTGGLIAGPRKAGET